jgi:hypothetical protein
VTTALLRCSDSSLILRPSLIRQQTKSGNVSLPHLNHGDLHVSKPGLWPRVQLNHCHVSPSQLHQFRWRAELAPVMLPVKQIDPDRAHGESVRLAPRWHQKDAQ